MGSWRPRGVYVPVSMVSLLDRCMHAPYVSGAAVLSTLYSYDRFLSVVGFFEYSNIFRALLPKAVSMYITCLPSYNNITNVKSPSCSIPNPSYLRSNKCIDPIHHGLFFLLNKSFKSIQLECPCLCTYRFAWESSRNKEPPNRG